MIMSYVNTIGMINTSCVDVLKNNSSIWPYLPQSEVNILAAAIKKFKVHMYSIYQTPTQCCQLVWIGHQKTFQAST